MYGTHRGTDQFFGNEIYREKVQLNYEIISTPYSSPFGMKQKTELIQHQGKPPNRTAVPSKMQTFQIAIVPDFPAVFIKV